MKLLGYLQPHRGGGVARHAVEMVRGLWVGSGRGRKTTRPGANGVVELSPFEFLDRLTDLAPRRGSTASLSRGVRPESQAQARRHGS